MRESVPLKEQDEGKCRTIGLMSWDSTDFENGVVTVDRPDLDSLFGVLTGAGYGLVGPTVRDGAIVYDRIESASDLPL